MRSRLVSVSGAAVALALAFTVSACAADSPTVLPTEEPATPIFVSDEEALAAAEAAYAEYLTIADQVIADGGADSQRLGDVVTGAELERQAKEFELFADSSLRGEGSTVFSQARLQSVEHTGPTTIEVTIYLCQDISDTRILSAEGEDRTPSERAVVLPMSVALAGTKDELKLTRSEVWPTDFCL
ncbi:hypothetical protein [Salinibacterium sp. ZJ450]|uniref:hypothetical protein n=1 Tax=Salinibacterium sp. ZJ450 TaxID=2708338 RepID=UPI00141FD571|nr:hypothetical protein [Salinibacterium sp. ZJ450]